MVQSEKVPYVCGALTELPSKIIDEVKLFYSRIGDLFEELTGNRAFVPHEHYDPIKFAYFTPKEVDDAERRQVCFGTSLVVAVNIAPTWGGGIEIEMAHRHNVPVVLLSPYGKKISRLLAGNPAIECIIEYNTYDDAIIKLRNWV